jgi:hypothetical protein
LAELIASDPWPVTRGPLVQMAASSVYTQPTPAPGAGDGAGAGPRQPSRFELGELERLRKENERLKKENRGHVDRWEALKAAAKKKRQGDRMTPTPGPSLADSTARYSTCVVSACSSPLSPRRPCVLMFITAGYWHREHGDQGAAP